MTQLDRLAARLEGVLSQHPRTILLSCVALCLATFTGYSHVKNLWMDEVLELAIARLPSPGAVWDVLRSGEVQIDPPLLHISQHYLIRLLPDNALAMRLIPILGFCLMCASFSVLLWRYLPPLFAASAFFLPYATVMRSRAMDARTYGPMFGCMAFALLAWDRIQTPNPAQSNRWRVIFTVALALTFSTHFYSIFFLLPLALGELGKWRQRGAIDWKTVLCVPVALIPFAIWLPGLLAASKLYARGYFYRASFNNLAEFYSFAIASLPMALILIALVIAAYLLRDMPPTPAQSTPTGQQILLAVVLGFLLVPFAGYLAGALVTGFFVPYYHMIAAFGVVLAIPLLAAQLSYNNRTIGAILLASVLTHGIGLVTLRGLTGWRRVEQTYPTMAELTKSLPDPTLDIVIPAPAHYYPMTEHNRHEPAVKRLIYLHDTAHALRLLNTNSADILYERMRRWIPVRTEPFEEYLAKHPHFYMGVLGPVNGIQEWQVDVLQKERRADFRWLCKSGNFDLYEVTLRTQVKP